MSKSKRLGTYFIAGILGAVVATLSTVRYFTDPWWARTGWEMMHLILVCIRPFAGFLLGFIGGLIAGVIAARIEGKHWNTAVVIGGLLGGLLAAFLTFLVFG